MIAIPNMDKPMNCDKCPIRIAELFGVYYKDGKSKRIKITGCDSSKYNGNTLAEDHKLMYKDCPIIDIVQCKDCKWGDTGIDEEGKPFWKCIGIHYGGTKPTDFCSYGERRSE